MRILCGKKFIFLLIITISILFIPNVFKLKWGSVSVEQWHYKEGHRIVHFSPFDSNWIKSENTSKYLLQALIVSEDSRFYKHYGIDFMSIKNSMLANWSAGRYLRGASTISQQVVRAAFLEQKKLYYGKLEKY